MPRAFETPQDAVQRLDRCVLLYEERPVYIQFHSNDYMFAITDLITRKSEIIDVNEAIEKNKLSLRSAGLGNMNIQSTQTKKVFFISRLPLRQYKAGIHVGNTRFVKNVSSSGKIDYNQVPAHYISSDELGRTILREYPDFWKTYEEFKKLESNNEIGISPHFSMVRDDLGITKLRYWLTPIAYITDDGDVCIPEKYNLQAHILRQELPNIKTKTVTL